MQAHGLPQQGVDELKAAVDKWYAATINFEDVRPKMIDAYLAHFTEAPLEERAAYLAGLPAEKARLWREREALIADLVAVDDFAAEELRPPGTLRGRILAATIEHPLRTVALSACCAACIASIAPPDANKRSASSGRMFSCICQRST